MEIVRNNQLTASRPLDDIPASSCFCGSPTYRLFLAGVAEQLEVKEPARIRFWEQKNYFPITVDFLDGKEPQTLALSIQSAREFLVSRGVRSVQDVAVDFFAHPHIHAIRQVHPVFFQFNRSLSPIDLNLVISLARDYNLSLAEAAHDFCTISLGIIPLFQDFQEKRLFFREAVAAKRAEACAALIGVDYKTCLKPHLLMISRFTKNYGLSVEQVSVAIKNAHFLWPMASKCITFEELVQVLCFVKANPPQGERTRRIPSQRDLPRTLIYSQGKVLLVFNKHGRKKYRLKTQDPLVGAGVFCRVKEALELETGEKYVVVVQRNSAGAQHEFAVQRQLQGPGVAAVLGTVSWKEKFGIIMPRYETDLHKLLDRHVSPLPLPVRRQMAVALLEAVARMHDQGVIHRDIKADNIFVDASHNVYLGDFGLAAKVGEGHRVAGTPAFWAPEIFFSPQTPVTPAVDNWALGLVLWDLFSPEIEQSRAFAPKMTYKKFMQKEMWRAPFQTLNWLGGTPSLVPSEAEIVRRLLLRDPSVRMSASQALVYMRYVAASTPADSLSSTSTIAPIPAPQPPV